MANHPKDGIDATDDEELSDDELKDLSGGAVVGIPIAP